MNDSRINSVYWYESGSRDGGVENEERFPGFSFAEVGEFKRGLIDSRSCVEGSPGTGFLASSDRHRCWIHDFWGEARGFQRRFVCGDMLRARWLFCCL